MKKIAFGMAIFLLFSFSLFSQWKSKEVYAVKIDEPLKVDGTLDEPAWKKAKGAIDFIQLQPERGQNSPFQTVVKILYDQKFIYFGFLCYDPIPEKIAARMTKRDSDVRADDSVYVLDGHIP